MTKIDKSDLENIKLIVKESKINGVAKIKIKKNDYEIEITSNDFVENNVSVQKIEKNTEVKEVEKTNEVPFLLEDGQTIARIKYEKLNKNSNIVYGRDIKSNYQNQGLKLSKHFK